MSSRLQLQEHRGLLAVAAQRDREDVAGLVVANNLLGESRNGIHLTNSTKSRAMGGGNPRKTRFSKMLRKPSGGGSVFGNVRISGSMKKKILIPKSSIMAIELNTSQGGSYLQILLLNPPPFGFVPEGLESLPRFNILIFLL